MAPAMGHLVELARIQPYDILVRSRLFQGEHRYSTILFIVLNSFEHNIDFCALF
jgi:hypothetical protein